MITSIDITARQSFAGGAAFGSAGSYVRLDGVARGELDPLHPANSGIALIERAPRNLRGKVEYRCGFTLLHPAAAARGNGDC